MDPLFCCPPDELIRFRQNQPSIRCRRMKTFFTHAKVPCDLIANLIRTPCYPLTENMVAMHLENQRYMISHYTDSLEILFLNLAYHPSVLSVLFSHGLHMDLTLLFNQDGYPVSGACPWLVRNGVCTCWQEGLHDHPDSEVPVFNIMEESGEVITLALNR